MEKITHKGNIIEVVQKEVEIGGKIKTFEYARRSPGVRLIVPQNNKIILTKEFRHELNAYDYRLPGGKVFDSLNEYNDALEQKANIEDSAKVAAIKEAAEEIGFHVKDLSLFHKSACGATVIWDLYYFVVNSFDQTTQNLEEDEDITVQLFDTEEVRAMCLDGRVSEERSALILLRFLNK